MGLRRLYEIPGVEVIYPASERDGTLRKGFAIRRGSFQSGPLWPCSLFRRDPKRGHCPL